MTPEGWTDARTAPQPLWLQAPLDYHRMIDLPDRPALYVQLNMVTGIKGQSLDQFAQKIGERVAATNPRTLILGASMALGSPLWFFLAEALVLNAILAVSVAHHNAVGRRLLGPLG